MGSVRFTMQARVCSAIQRAVFRLTEAAERLSEMCFGLMVATKRVQEIPVMDANSRIMRWLGMLLKDTSRFTGWRLQ